jgi:hypothetical protein
MAHHIEQNAIVLELGGRLGLPTTLQGTGTRSGVSVACGLCVAQLLPTAGARGSPQDQSSTSNLELPLSQGASRGCQAGVVDSFSTVCLASADLNRCQGLHFTLEFALSVGFSAKYQHA